MTSEFKQNLKEALKEKRPNLGDNSIKTYISTLVNINKELDGDKTVDWFNKNANEILDAVSKKNSKTGKTILSAVFVLTENKEIREQMIKLATEVNDEYKTNKKTDKQEQNWETSENIKAKYDEYYTKTITILKKKLINKKDLQNIIDFLLLGFLSGVLIPPRRSLDYALLKIKNFDKSTDNYYKAGKCFFNRYKTDKVFNKQEITLPKQLNDVVKKWLKINPTDYMLFSSNQQPLTSPQITLRFNDIFGKNISTSIFRHIYISEHFGDVSKKMEEVAEQMSHSVSTQQQYIVR